MSFMDEVRGKVKGRGLRIVYPEGVEERAVRASALLRDQDLVKPVLLGPRAEIESAAARFGVPLEGIEVRDPAADDRTARYASVYQELRKHKGCTAEQAAARAVHTARAAARTLLTFHSA